MVHKGSKASTASNALSTILCILMIDGNLGLNAAYIPMQEYIIADQISRFHQPHINPNFDALLQEFTQLHSCNCY